jgi:hypothetical protein
MFQVPVKTVSFIYSHVLSKKELHNIIIERGLWKNIGKASQACVLKNDTSGL